ncbi:hypothetical protein BWQ96_07068 [Gracilariopsis chorda]|uniref:Uncharacterized protein n=1 Tax=Gracilariopsis chorda TaxID=448386 RepID=A0A2V3IM92_9FLOR|nr:hypothetical protein BWQ96_07068 [Gracilariopsis chorda]|eukprot:PXF43193.1 hypothetical protein BWQ96_07068 [Gracilariopsis chorda]
MSSLDTRSPDTASSLSSQPTTPHGEKTGRNLYLHHESVVNALQGSDTLYQDAVARAKKSAKNAKHATDTADRIRATEESLSDYLDQLEKQHVRKMLLRRKMRQKLSSVQSQLDSASQNCADADREAVHAQRQALQDMETCKRLRGDAKKLHKSERMRRQLLDKMFDGLQAGSLQENLVEEERDALVLVTNRKKDSLTAQRQAYQLLTSALVEVGNARKDLWDARITNTVDLFNGGAIGMMAGMQSQIRFKAARTKVQCALSKLEQAVVLNPKLPLRKTLNARSKDKMSLGMTDIFFDGVTTDLMARLAIDKAEAVVESVEESLVKSIAMQKKHVAQLREDYSSSSSELERTSKELVRIRAELIHEAFS